ncbi:hypothetical protein ACUWCL_28425, partial [Klebsiella pneumoniae]|uniref:hypothetical protein n=1 Tax=Klebsiella pneumoniae TaxID=573 RepID=UPI0040558BBB
MPDEVLDLQAQLAQLTGIVTQLARRSCGQGDPEQIASDGGREFLTICRNYFIFKYVLIDGLKYLQLVKDNFYLILTTKIIIFPFLNQKFLNWL